MGEQPIVVKAFDSEKPNYPHARLCFEGGLEALEAAKQSGDPVDAVRIRLEQREPVKVIVLSYMEIIENGEPYNHVQVRYPAP